MADPPRLPPSSPSPSPSPITPSRDFLTHLETYLSKRDGVDKLLKISRYASKIILSSSLLSPHSPLSPRLRSFDSSLGVSRKAFRLGKFVQDVNALRKCSSSFDSRETLVLSVIAYGGEGVYYFMEQFVWLAKSGLIKNSRELQLISAWSELIGYIGSIGLKVRELRLIGEDEECLKASIEVSLTRGEKCVELEENLKKLREKKLMKRLSVIQDLADGLMAFADIRNGKGKLSDPLLLSSAGMLSALISTHKNWISC